jgi:hypothetical protein
MLKESIVQTLAVKVKIGTMKTNSGRLLKGTGVMTGMVLRVKAERNTVQNKIL